MNIAMNPARKALLLRLIGVWKLCKGIIVLFVGIGLLRMLRHDQSGTPKTDPISNDWFHRLTRWMLDHVHRLPPEAIRNVCIISFIYAALFMIEGTGLLLRKRWAEWMVALTTSGLLPVEIYEVIHKPTLVRVAILLANTAIAAYFIYDLTRPRTELH